MRVVLDTNVLVSGLLVPSSPPGQIVQAWRHGQFTVVMSDPLLKEVERVLGYPKIQKRLGWTPDLIVRYVSLLRFLTDMASLPPSPPVVSSLRDPTDLILLETYQAGNADLIVSGDKDLLALHGEYPVESPTEFASRLQ